MNRYDPERLEGLRSERIKINEEVETLRTALVWGPVGIEAALNLLIPGDISLFFGEMDVPKARGQFEEMDHLLNSEGVQTVRVRDLLAAKLAKSNEVPVASNLAEMERMIKTEGRRLHSLYRIEKLDVLDWVGPIIAADAERYGSDKTAILLNQMLLNRGGLPVANILFGRDQSTAVGDTFIWSNMRHLIRRPEVKIWQYALEDYLKDSRQIEITGDGRLEGGDVIVNGGICYIGVGGRTNREGVYQLADNILGQGLRLMVVYHGPRDRGEIGHQEAMHLDTFSMPLPDNAWVVCPEEAVQREVIEIVDGGGSFEMIGHADFLHHLVEERGQTIIPVSKEQQLAYQTNYINLGGGRVMVTLNGDGYLIEQMQKRDLVVYDADLRDITQGYGGGHCSLAAIERG